MAMPYRSMREHLDDVVLLAAHVFRRRRLAIAGGEARAIAELDLQVIDLGELIETRLELSALRDFTLPLDRLRQAFQLEATEQRCLWLLVALAVSAEVRMLAGVTGQGVPLELLDEVVYGRPDYVDRFPIELGERGRLLRYGLVEPLDGSGGPLARSVRVAERVVDLAYGIDGLAGDVARFATLADDTVSELLIPDGVRTVVAAALARHVDRGDGPIPLVRGSDGAGRRSLIASCARSLRARTLLVRCEELPADMRAIVAIQREAVLHRAVVVLAGVDTLSDDRLRFLDVGFADYVGPVAATANRQFAGGRLAVRRGIVAIDLPALTEAERAQLWRRHLGDSADPTVITDAAARYRLSGGQIERAARACPARSPTLADVHAGVSSALDDKLALLGTRIEWRQRWDDLVLPEESHDELVEMVARTRFKKRVLDDWGFGDKVAKGLGLAALFSGPPGTGKTMAAGLVAQELGLDLYQIDLSRMVSKYVGETEKNLAQVFDAAEAGHAILLFDEADALFSKRTEVKSSVDRYANLEVNYLLQRMEAFSGITILTTNFDSAIDDAFRRRLAIRIAFTLPEREERRRLWQSVIPERALGAGIDFGELAERFEMSGGYIKNAALRAAYLAAADGATITMQHLLRAAGAEYASMGKVVSERERERGLR